MSTAASGPWGGARYCPLPYVLLADRKLAPGALAVLAAIHRLESVLGQARAGRAAIAKSTGFSVQQVRRHLRKLVARKLVTVIRRGGGTEPSHYRLAPLSDVYSEEARAAANRLPSSSQGSGSASDQGIDQGIESDPGITSDTGVGSDQGEGADVTPEGSTDVTPVGGSDVSPNRDIRETKREEEETQTARSAVGEQANSSACSPGDQDTKPDNEGLLPWSPESSRPANSGPDALGSLLSSPDDTGASTATLDEQAPSSPGSADLVSSPPGPARAEPALTPEGTPQPPSKPKSPPTPSGRARAASHALVEVRRETAELPYVAPRSNDPTSAQPRGSERATDPTPLAAWVAAHADLEPGPAPEEPGPRKVRERALTAAASSLWSVWKEQRPELFRPSEVGMGHLSALIDDLGPVEVARRFRALLARPWPELQPFLAAVDPMGHQGAGPASWSGPDLRGLFALPEFRREPIIALLARLAAGETVTPPPAKGAPFDHAAERGVRTGPKPKFPIVPKHMRSKQS